MLALELDGVSATYGANRPILEAVSMSLERGRLCAVLGGNGAGKSTLVRLIAGILGPSGGTLRLLGDDAAGLALAERARRVAVVPQRTEVALGFSVAEVVALGRAPHQGALMRATRADDEAVAQAIDTCELGALASRPVAELSGGEQQRVHIARALAQQAPILVLDEAAAHLDVRHAQALYRLLRREVDSRGLACLAVMHDLAAAAHADQVVLLHQGRVIADGPTEEVMTPERLHRAFGADIEVGRTAAGQRYFVAR